MESYFVEAAVLKIYFNIFFLEICRGFSARSKKLVLENYVLAHHTAAKDHAEIL